MTKFKSPLIWLALPILILGPTRCAKIEDGLSQIKWQIDFDLVNTSWDIQFKDASTGDFIGQDNEIRVEVSLSGPDYENILDLAGIRHERFYSTKGILGLVLHPDREKPGEQNPARFIIHAKADGYLSVDVPVEAFTDGIHPIEIQLINIDTPPVGVKAFHQEGIELLVDGKTADSLSLYTPGNDLELFIAQGTEFADQNGSKLGGLLDISIALWDCTQETAMRSIPGGPLALLNSTQFDLGIKQPASQVLISVKDQYGKIATQLNKSMRVSFLVSSKVYHPELGRYIAPTDVLPVYVLNDSAGTWSRGNTVVLESFQNKILATLTVHKPGLFHFGWIDQDYCKTPLPLAFSTLPGYSSIPYSFRVKVYRNYNSLFQYLFSYCIAGPTNSNSELRYLPTGKELIIRFEPYIDCSDPYYRNPDPLLLTGECIQHGAIGIDINNDLVPIPPGETRELEVVFIDTQHNNTEYTPAAFAGYYRQSGSTCWKSALVYSGTTYLYNVAPGEQYEMGINYKGQFHKTEVFITESGLIHVDIEIN